MKVLLRTKILGTIDVKLQGRGLLRTIALKDLHFKQKVFPFLPYMNEDGRVEFVIRLWFKKNLVYFPELKKEEEE